MDKKYLHRNQPHLHHHSCCPSILLPDFFSPWNILLNLLQVPAPCRTCFLLHKGSSTKIVFSSWPQVEPGDVEYLEEFLHQKGCQALEQPAQGSGDPIPGGIWGHGLVAVLGSWLGLRVFPAYINLWFIFLGLSVRECPGTEVISESTPLLP